MKIALESWRVLKHLRARDGHVEPGLVELHDIMPVLIIGALAVVAAVVVGVVVASPLDVHPVVGTHHKVGRPEVILRRRVRLHDVTWGGMKRRMRTVRGPR